MNSRKSLIIVLITAVIVSVLVLRFNRDSPPVPEEPKSATISTPVRKPSDKTLVISEDYDWDEVTEEEIDKILEYYKPTSPEEGFSQTAVAAIGDTIITNPYEGLPGEFVYTKITLMKEENDRGKWLRAKFDTFTIDVSGNERTISLSPSSMEAQIPANGAPFSIGIGRKEGKYEIRMRANKDIPSAYTLEMEGDLQKE